MDTFMFATVIFVYSSFVTRFAWHVILWLRASGQSQYRQNSSAKASGSAYLVTLLDLLLLRRTFGSGKMLWIGSWTFHVSLLFVGLRHLRFICRSLPDCFILLQPVGVFAGYLLAFSLFYLIMLRTMFRQNRYASDYNYFLLCMLFVISISGLVMRNFFVPDLAAVKYFILGITGLQPRSIPDSPLFIFHFAGFLLLLPFLPLHLLAAPLVTLDANRREEELRFIIHDC